MVKKEKKKLYVPPRMEVYEMGRSVILAGSSDGNLEELPEEGWNSW